MTAADFEAARLALLRFVLIAGMIVMFIQIVIRARNRKAEKEWRNIDSIKKEPKEDQRRKSKSGEENIGEE